MMTRRAQRQEGERAVLPPNASGQERYRPHA
ncbi:hypothetical protein FHT08_002253 [Xanthomonas campestris]|nr:hypothetical protein [Xanthomonas sp. CFBP 8151]